MINIIIVLAGLKYANNWSPQKTLLIFSTNVSLRCILQITSATLEKISPTSQRVGHL